MNKDQHLNNFKLHPKELSEKALLSLEQRYEEAAHFNIFQNGVTNSNINLSDLLQAFHIAAKDGQIVEISGRITKIQYLGGLIFASIQNDIDQIELKLSKTFCGPSFLIWKKIVRPGDLISVKGKAIWSRDKAPQIYVKEFKILSLCGISKKSSGLGENTVSTKKGSPITHQEMISNKNKIISLKIRSIALNTIRQYLAKNNFQEQITPILNQSFYGGKSEPFITHSRSQMKNFYLRLTSEIALKTLIVGGMNRMYEIGPSFRNERQGKKNLIGFTHLEAYAPYVNYNKMIKIIKELLIVVFNEVIQWIESKKLSHKKYNAISIKKIDVISAKKVLLNVSGQDYTTDNGLKNISISCERELPQTREGKADLVYAALKKLVYNKLETPTIITELPAGLSPLIETSSKCPDMLQRAFVVIGGIKIMEIFFSQRNPLIVLKALEKQAEDWTGSEIHRDYRNFIHALFCGLPPTSVFTISIERLFMLLTGEKNIQNIHLKV